MKHDVSEDVVLHEVNAESNDMASFTSLRVPLLLLDNSELLGPALSSSQIHSIDI